MTTVSAVHEKEGLIGFIWKNKWDLVPLWGVESAHYKMHSEAERVNEVAQSQARRRNNVAGFDTVQEDSELLQDLRASANRYRTWYRTICALNVAEVLTPIVYGVMESFS